MNKFTTLVTRPKTSFGPITRPYLAGSIVRSVEVLAVKSRGFKIFVANTIPKTVIYGCQNYS